VNEIEIRRPDDWHVHLRDGELLAEVAASSSGFGRVLAMPNLVPPVATTAQGRAYRGRLLAAGVASPLLAAYLTDATDPDDLEAGFEDGVFAAAKLYPAKATTNSEHGVTSIEAILPALERMAAIGMPLCVHGEVTHAAVDVFDRERVFLDRVLLPLLHRLPDLRCVVEHATTRDAVAFVRAHDRAGCTITPHHLWWNRNALFDGGLRPHAYCLPVLKREEDRVALVEAATSGDPRFFAGTDSAPHRVERKEMDCGCAGVFNAPTAVAAYAQVFDQAGALDRLEGFLSVHGARFYGLHPSDERIHLARERWTPPERVGGVAVFLGGRPLEWRVVA
jgi:dihydroorotase